MDRSRLFIGGSMLLLLASNCAASQDNVIRITSEDLGMVAAIALFTLGPAWIIGRRLIRSSAKSVAKAPDAAHAARADKGWEAKRKRGLTEQFRGVDVKGGLLPKSALVSGFNVHYDGQCPEWHSVRGSTTVYKSDGNLQVFLPQGFEGDVDFLGNIVDIYRTDRGTYSPN